MRKGNVGVVFIIIILIVIVIYFFPSFLCGKYAESKIKKLKEKFENTIIFLNQKITSLNTRLEDYKIEVLNLQKENEKLLMKINRLENNLTQYKSKQKELRKRVEQYKKGFIGLYD